MNFLMTQLLRRSQFVMTYGPGSLLEGPQGPRIIPSARIGLFVPGSSLDPLNYEISDQRMSMGLLNNARIYRLPSNAEIGQSQNFYLYRTKPFPSWKLCLNSSSHGGGNYVLYRGMACPNCHNSGRRGTEAIRFLLACPNGHLDEFDWHHFVHRGAACSNKSNLNWRGGGGALSGITVECPTCHATSVNLGTAYGQNWQCNGRYPEREPLNSLPLMAGCTAAGKIIQRQASNLRVPELWILFSIPPRTTRLHNLLQVRPIWDNILGSSPSTMEEFSRIMRNLANARVIGQNTLDEILSHSWNGIESAIRDNLSPVPTTYRGLIMEELRALEDSSLHGSPPVTRPVPDSPVIFHVDPNLVRIFNGFRVTPILTLRTVVVQHGYRREVDTGPDSSAAVVDVGFPDPLDPDKSWYPGAEFLGEGVFISRESQQRGVSGNAVTEWQNAVAEDSTLYPARVFRDISHHDELEPGFVWWHTFSHLLIRSISAEAGYSSASVRERVYYNPESSEGGVLLFATQPGTEGTLGGLIALVPYFGDILETGLQQVQTCSGDPLCQRHVFRAGGYNGAACYSCLLLSETSCEHRNMWLDRNIVLENHP